VQTSPAELHADAVNSARLLRAAWEIERPDACAAYLQRFFSSYHQSGDI
jgi:hypothetical protein